MHLTMMLLRVPAKSLLKHARYLTNKVFAASTNIFVLCNILFWLDMTSFWDYILYCISFIVNLKLIIRQQRFDQCLQGLWCEHTYTKKKSLYDSGGIQKF